MEKQFNLMVGDVPRREDLKPIFEHVKSYYKKAQVEIDYDRETITLYSYGYKLAVISNKEQDIYINTSNSQWCSNTSLRHLKEFIRQYVSFLKEDMWEIVESGLSLNKIRKYFLRGE